VGMGKAAVLGGVFLAALLAAAQAAPATDAYLAQAQAALDVGDAAHAKRLVDAALGEGPMIALQRARLLYNRGVARSSGDIVVLSHDDIEFLDPAPWLGTLKRHLADADVVGIAGTTKVVYGSWARAGPPYTFRPGLRA